MWESWMTRAAESTEFAPPDGADPPPVDAAMAERIAACRPLYSALAEHRLTP